MAYVSAASDDSSLSELFHECSKLGKYDSAPTEHAVAEIMARMTDSLPYNGRPETLLPSASQTPCSEQLRFLNQRKSPRALAPCAIPLQTLSQLLHAAYGINRSNENTEWPRPFRTVPSAGALYPLELFLYHSGPVESLDEGVFHYSPARNALRQVLKPRDCGPLPHCFVQPELVEGAAVVVMISAVFERAVFKYGDRGYRFALLEAGHAAQNLLLAANVVGLAGIPLGGYYDRDLDALLKLDGVTQSVIYCVAAGRDA